MSVPSSFDAVLSRADIPVATGSRLDDWFAHLLRTPARVKAWYWGAPLVVTLVAALLRLINLGSPHALVFDETYYVKDAWTLWNNGYESMWTGSNADKAFVEGHVNGYSSSGSYVVHPPLGKWLIALGMVLFGPTNAFGWRFTVAIAGILAVWLVIIITRRLTHSTLIACIAGGLMAVDGLAIALSRVAVLDNILMIFTLTGFYLVLLDRGWAQKRLASRIDAARAAGRNPSWGPALWWRPWLLLAGIAFGAACAVKWSGIWFLAVFGIYVVVMDAIDRRRLGIPFWFTSSALKQAPAAFLTLVPIALVTYLSSWTGWIVTSGGYYRHWIDDHPDLQAHGIWSWIPMWAQDLWFYHQSAYGFHVGLSTPHPYQSNPLMWLLMDRPTSMFYEGSNAGQNGCAFSACSSAINPVDNPFIWYAAVAALVYLVYRFIRYRQWTVGIVLAGVVAGYVPWLMYLNRTVFSFYSIVFVPYLLIGLAITIGIILGNRSDPREKRERRLALVITYAAVVLVFSAFFYPLWTGIQTPLWFWQIHMWLPSWV